MRESGIVALKPTTLTYEEAAAVPDGSLMALTMLRPLSPLRGKSVLVYGAAGSIGSAAVQLLAHEFGTEVTAVCDTKDVERVRLLGARDIIDRLREDFTTNGKTYDIVFDAVGKHSFSPFEAIAARRELHLDHARRRTPATAADDCLRVLAQPGSPHGHESGRGTESLPG